MIQHTCVIVLSSLIFNNIKPPDVYKSKHDVCSEYIFIEIGFSFQSTPRPEIMVYINRHA